MTTTAVNLEAPAITLKNGIRVANFSSPHEFNFEDLSVLPACANSRSTALNLARNDREVPWDGPRSPSWPAFERGVILAVTPGFATTPEIVTELEELEGHWDVDIVLVPFPVLQSLRDEKILEKFKKVATVITADRITKAASTTKFGR